MGKLKKVQIKQQLNLALEKQKLETIETEIKLVLQIFKVVDFFTLMSNERCDI